MKVYWLATILTVCGFLSYGMPNEPDSLRKVLANELPDSTKVNVLLQLSAARAMREDSAYFFARGALQLAQKIHYAYGIGEAYRNMIFFAKSAGEIDSLVALAQRYFRETRPQSEWLTLLSASSRNIVIGNHLTAFREANTFLKNYKNSDDRLSYAKAWNLIGEVHRVSKNLEKAREAYLKAGEYATVKGKILFLSPFINLGTIYLEAGNIDSAFRRYDFMEQHLARTDDEHSNTFAYIKYRKAQVFLAKKDLDRAEREAKASLDLYTSLNHTEGTILAEGALCEVFFEKRSYRPAVAHGKHAVDLALKTDYVINGVDHVCHLVSQSLYALGDADGAFHYAGTEIDMKERLSGPALSAAMTNTLLEIENEKQQLEHDLLNKQVEAAQLKIREQRIINTATIAGVVIMIGVSLLLYKNMRTKQKLNMQLREKQDEILAQTEELTAQAEELRSSNEEMEAINANLESIVNDRTRVILDQNQKLRDYAYFNAHQVRGPLASILGLVAILELEFTDTTLRIDQLRYANGRFTTFEALTHIKPAVSG